MKEDVPPKKIEKKANRSGVQAASQAAGEQRLAPGQEAAAAAAAGGTGKYTALIQLYFLLEKGVKRRCPILILCYSLFSLAAGAAAVDDRVAVLRAREEALLEAVSSVPVSLYSMTLIRTITLLFSTHTDTSFYKN